MFESFKKKEVDDTLSAWHVNRLSKQAERTGGMKSNTFMNIHQTDSVMSMSGIAPWHQFIVEISARAIDDPVLTRDEDTTLRGRYLVKVRWFSHDFVTQSAGSVQLEREGEWFTDQNKDWQMDASGLGDTGQFYVGARLTAYWDAQRAMFIPVFPNCPIELMLGEDHPGKSKVYKSYVGTWCMGLNDWRYDCTETCDHWVYCIDHRYGVPYPAAGSRGLYIARPSHHYGIIWENVNLDCVSPGTCAAQNINMPCPDVPIPDPYTGDCAGA
jgi:hypothetical protein